MFDNNAILINSVKLDAALSTTASAIQSKLDSQEIINFDYKNGTGFASTIESIIPEYVNDDFLDPNKPIGEIYETTISTLVDYQLYGKKGITSLILPNVDTMKQLCCTYCSNLEVIKLPKLTTIEAQALQYCTSIKFLIFPKCNSMNKSTACGYMTALEGVDLGGDDGIISSLYVFRGCSKLSILVLRSNTLWQLGGINAFMNTPFANYQSGGTLYVPSAIISSYESASNWSTILSYTNNQIKSIESTHTDPDAPIDLTLYYADGTPIPTT